MRKGIFSKLAVQNIRNNKITYIPYMITCIFCIAMIYMMEFLRDCPTLDQAVRHAAEVRMILSTGEVVVVIFCVIFLIYSNSFLMKRRQKEIGLYNILGLERNRTLQDSATGKKSYRHCTVTGNDFYNDPFPHWWNRNRNPCQ